MMAVTTPTSAIDPQNDELNGAEKNNFPAGPRHARGNNDPREDNRGGKQQRHGQQPRRDKRDVHGWVILDKPIGMTSTPAVAVVKRLFSAKRAGHAGTLDPLASGGLPIALGEATKTVPFVMDGRKAYRFMVRWGEERDTDDADGAVVATGDSRPARDGEAVALEARPVEIYRLELVGLPDADHAEFEAECGKGTYVRALARDF